MGRVSKNNYTHDMLDGKEEDGQSRKLDWHEAITKGTSLHKVDLATGRNGWAIPPSNLFQVRGANYFSKKVKTTAPGEPLLKSIGMDWLKSSTKLEHVLSHPSNIVKRALENAHAHEEGLKAFILAVNLMIPGKDHLSAVLYFMTEEPIRDGSLLYRFIHGDDTFRNNRFKLINKIVRGPWVVKAATGNHAACLPGKALTCHYIKGPNYLEIDVDLGSSSIASAILHLALGYVTSLAVDLAFVIESQTPDELPENLLGAVRMAHLEIGGASAVEAVPDASAERKLDAQLSWKRLGRNLSLLAGRPTRVEPAPEEEVE